MFCNSKTYSVFAARATVPKLWLLSQRRNYRMFQQLSEIDGCAAQVDAIAGELSKDFSDLRNFLRADLSTRGLADAAPTAKGIDATINRLGKAVEELKRQREEAAHGGRGAVSSLPPNALAEPDRACLLTQTESYDT